MQTACCKAGQMPGVCHGTQKCQISSLTAHNKTMMVALIALGFEIPNSDPSSGDIDSRDHKIAANKKNSNLTMTNKKRKP